MLGNPEQNNVANKGITLTNGLVMILQKNLLLDFAEMRC